MPDTPSSTPIDDGDEPAIDVHQPGYDPDEAPGGSPGTDDPPDAVAEDDDRGGGPEQRAPEPPDAAR